PVHAFAKVRDGEGAIASARGARAPQPLTRFFRSVRRLYCPIRSTSHRNCERCRVPADKSAQTTYDWSVRQFGNRQLCPYRDRLRIDRNKFSPVLTLA